MVVMIFSETCLVLKLGFGFATCSGFWLFGWLKGQRGKMGVKGPQLKEEEDVSHRKTMPLAAETRQN